jgi:hypothetical protein
METERWNPNPNGRPVGSRNKRDAALWERLEARGDKDPAELLSEIATDTNETKELRAQAANWLLPYKYSKRGATPVPPEPSYWNVEVRIEKATTITQGRQNLQFITELKVQGRLSEQQADSLFTAHVKILDGLIEETKQMIAGGAPAIQTYRVEGGLPTPLPGTNTDFSQTTFGQQQLNGHQHAELPAPAPNVSPDVSPTPAKDPEP